MSDKKYPGWQRMISFDAPETILRRHGEHLAYRAADDNECLIVNMESITGGLEYKQGFCCRYEIHWLTGRGWQVYMLHTGIYASHPDDDYQGSLYRPNLHMSAREGK